jgi:hypothetical protein
MNDPTKGYGIYIEWIFDQIYEKSEWFNWDNLKFEVFISEAEESRIKIWVFAIAVMTRIEFI